MERDLSDDISLNDTAFLNCPDTDDKYDAASEVYNAPSKGNFKDTPKPKLNTTTGCGVPAHCNTALSSWGLPETILMKYRDRGIADMFAWQAECLANRNVLENGRNLVYSAPTSAGKTLVAEILALKTVLEKRKKVLVILPFVSVVREKMFYFQEILSVSGIRVEGFMGSHSPPGGFKAVQFAVCTIEKANSIVNKLLEEGALGDLGTVIIDEMHLLGDASRGYLLELLLTKVRYMCARNPNIRIQVIGMSATLPNLELLAKWLNAELYTTDFRPIPLHEFCLIGGDVLDTGLSVQRRLQAAPDLAEDTDHILQLCLETIGASCSVLIFCPTKNWCENLAQQISVAFWKLGRSTTHFGQCLRTQLNADAIVECLAQLRNCPVGLDTVLRRTVSFGVAFHHAGLTLDERDIIEGAFRSGALRVLVATSTLSSGVNLPAQRVIIRTPLFHGRPLDAMTYRQMIGRAGRMGRDTSGESVLVGQLNERRIVGELMRAELRPIASCLEGAGRLKRAILEVIASGVASTPEDVRLFTSCTLLAASVPGQLALDGAIEESVAFLVRHEFVRVQQRTERAELHYVATALAKACLSSALPPEDGLALFEELERARQCFVLDTDLHLLYLVTPYSVCQQWASLDWMLFLDMWEKLAPSMRRVAELVGVRESFIFNATRGKVNSSTAKLYHRLQVHRRFYTALALQDLVNEVPLPEVAARFQCSRGMLQSLQQSASMFAGMVTAFCGQLKWKSLEILVAQFQDRLQFGIQHELLELLKLPSLNGPRARCLYTAGIESLAELAACDPCTLETILHGSVPFESAKEREYDAVESGRVRGIWITGKQGLTARQAADMIVNDARKYLQLEVGAAVMKWDAASATGNTSISSRTSSLSNLSVHSELDTNTHRERNDGESRGTECRVDEANDSVVLDEESVSSYKVAHVSSASSNDSMQNTSVTSVIAEERITEPQRIIVTNCDKSNTSFNGNRSGGLSDDDGVFDYNWTPLDNDISALSMNTSGVSPKLLLESNVLEHVPTLESSFNRSLVNASTRSDSLFEDSLCLDSRLCNALDYSTSNELGYDADLGGDTSLFENAFSSSIDIAPETDAMSECADSVPDVVDASQLDSENTSSLINTLHNSVKKGKNIVTGTPQKRKRNEICSEKTVQCLFEDSPKKRKTCVDDGGEITHVQTEPVDLSTIDIVDVCESDELFLTFCKELKTKATISCAVACECATEVRPLIGQAALRSETLSDPASEQTSLTAGERLVTGISVSWGGNTAYYLSLSQLKHVRNAEKLQVVQAYTGDSNASMRMFDYKAQAKVLYAACNIRIRCSVDDPTVAAWLLEPEAHEKNLQAMALHYAPEAVGLAQLAGSCTGVGSIALNPRNAILSRIRACVEAVATWHIVEAQRDALADQNVRLLDTFRTEMQSVSCLTQMELVGLCIDQSETNTLITTVQEQMAALQQRAFALAGRRFSFTSSKDVGKVIGLYRGRKVSTNKQTLEQNSHPISDLVLQWRKLSCTLTKMLFPVMRSIVDGRIHGCSVTHTATGRITMHEPNVQNVPRNFEVSKCDGDTVSLRVRDIFVPTPGKVFLSADYCQLELRLLAHLSQDPVLCDTLHTGSDVFRLIAAKLNGIGADEVTDVLRQRAKQLCYGIIYGMGAKALAEQLGSSEDEAHAFMGAFRTTYAGIQGYVQRTIERCRANGYVETLAGRRRHLAHITDANPVVRGQAERQAVNTTVQGSAADIAKQAMVSADLQLSRCFPACGGETRVALVLHLHDELLYEVPVHDLSAAMEIVRSAMETAVRLSVPLPVKLRVGPSWGRLEEVHG